MADSSRKTDRRIERTHQLLRDSLMALIVEKGYDTITVQDITDRANVARSTFYLHFRDKDELLFNTMRDLYIELIQNTSIVQHDDPLVGALHMADTTDFDHVAEHADFYRVMLSERGSMAFLVRVIRFLDTVMQGSILDPVIQEQQFQPRIPPALLSRMMTGAQIALLMWWLENEMPYSAQEMAQMGQDFTLHGLLWSLGMEHSEIEQAAGESKTGPQD